ncbi:MAG: carboxynorspermidine decarboxylase [Verrucomicrobia bacterium]|nr:carboxynorspermidine decarboxylase [Verrucomicrobiota bacterium]
MLDPLCVPSPAFVLELSVFKRNLACLDVFQREAGVQIILALKGFAMHRVFPLVHEITSGASASSLNEVRLAREFFENVHTYAPAYRDGEFDAIAERSCHITFNSLGEYSRYQHRLGGASAGLRVNPGYSDVATDLYNPCVKGSRLGVRADALRAGLPEGIEGLHVHNLCESGAQALATTIEHLESLYGPLLDQVAWLNMGGGHLITREGYDVATAINALRELRKRHPSLEIILEPGAAFAWRTGVLVATVLDLVETGDLPVAMLDVSFTAHMPDCLEMPYTPAVRGAVINGDAAHRYRFGGSSCLAGDVAGSYAFEQPLDIGQRLVFEDMMHYTMVKTNTFNGVALPAIGIWHEDERFELVAEFGYEDYRSRLS